MLATVPCPVVGRRAGASRVVAFLYFEWGSAHDRGFLMRWNTKYTDLGKKIAVLARNQAELARVLGLTQQARAGW